MTNPYAGRPGHGFWRQAMAGRAAEAVDPVVAPTFTISRTDLVATAGSCFAQHISRTLARMGFSYLVTERGEGGSYGVFPARFGNIYTVRQLRQLFLRAYGLFDPADAAWQRADGRWSDPFRPRTPEEGFESEDALREDGDRHLAAVREMFETSDVFVFTLGLTEAWVAEADGAVVPFAPGAVRAVTKAAYRFHNFTVAETEADLLAFLDDLRAVNPAVRVILTVSPVALIATYEDRHVLVSTTYSKAVLRVAAETAARSRPDVAYFPSYEIIMGPHARGAFHEDDLREVRPEAVAHVMRIFARHYLSEETAAPRIVVSAEPPTPAHKPDLTELRALERVICDEEVLDRP